MKSNMGNLDRLIRILVSALILILIFSKVLTGTAGVILLILAIIFAMTGFVSFCPVYALFRINTGKKVTSQN